MKQKIAITAIGSFSPLGNSSEEVWQNYLSEKTVISIQKIENKTLPVAAISNHQKKKIDDLLAKNPKYKTADKTVLYAILAARNAIENAGWKDQKNIGINIGSSRGATGLFEHHFLEFLQNGKANLLTSPTTTLGNIASSVAHDLKTTSVVFSHSITCSTALHALLNGVAWLQAGMATKFLVGGSEAPLTPFTIAQMQALKIYSKNIDEYPCQSFNLEKTKNTMVLGEGAAMACLELENNKALGYILGIGFTTEEVVNSTSISNQGIGFQTTMAQAMGNYLPSDIDAIIMHTPGTIKGDLSEYKAIEAVFGNKKPLLTTNKWKIGHTFGASGMFSIELAILMLQHQYFIGIPFLGIKNKPKKLNKIIVNAIGFGGNAVSVLLSL